MNLISERIDLSDFQPLDTQNNPNNYISNLNKYLNINLNTNKLNLKSNYFIRNTNNTIFIYEKYILPLYAKFQFNSIKISLKYTFTSNPDIFYIIDQQSNINDKINNLEYPYNDISLYKLSYEYKYSDIHKQFLNLNYNDIPWSDTFNGTRRCLRFLKNPRSIIHEYFRWCGLKSSTIFERLLDYSIQIVLPFFDKLKQLLHQNITHLPPECRYFFDIPTIAGYPSMKDRLLTDNPHEWLSNPSQTIYTSQWWTNAFLKTFGQAIIKEPEYILTLNEFAHNRWLWVTDGATRFSKLEVDGETLKTKLGAAVSLTDQELDKLIEEAIERPNSLASVIGVFIKPDEKGYKRRLIANVPLGGYIIAAYIRYLIESFVGSTPLFMKLSPTIDEMINVIDILKTKRLALPLDESAYDYNVTRESWEGFFGFLHHIFPHNKGVKYFKKYFDVAFWQFDNEKGKWLAGMPSGLALTSFLNSWMNYIKQGTITPGLINWAAGDDVLTFPYNEEVSLEAISEDYAKFGAVANPIKNWKSTRYAEYLKRFYSSTGTSGYPARIWSSLIWAGNERFYLPSDRLPEITELFKQFFDRIGLPLNEKYVAADLSRAISNKIDGFDTNLAIKWLHSPRVHGGFGCLPYNSLTFTWEVGDVRSKQVKNNLIRIPRFLEYSGEVKLKVGTYKLNTTSYRCGSSFKLAQVTTMDEWEKRLNREDIDYHGPFQSLIMDVIPLPSINFVSTTMMSSFASEMKFNSYPNLHGSWNTIASRLVNASLGLVDLIRLRMSEHSILTFI